MYRSFDILSYGQLWKYKIVDCVVEPNLAPVGNHSYLLSSSSIQYWNWLSSTVSATCMIVLRARPDRHKLHKQADFLRDLIMTVSAKRLRHWYKINKQRWIQTCLRYFWCLFFKYLHQKIKLFSDYVLGPIFIYYLFIYFLFGRGEPQRTFFESDDSHLPTLLRLLH